ncbi:MAG TPA: hypothetical protein VFZ98_00135 [Vicinamibacterales bacterium]
MNSAAEARFRIEAPNSRPRAIKVIGLDRRGGEAVRALAAGSWRNAAFFTAGPSNELTRLDGSTTRVDDEVREADLVVMVTSAEGLAQAAAEIGRVCSDRRINTTTLIVGAIDAADAALSRTLAQVRPWSLMLVLASDEHYVADMMAALRA